MIDTASTSRRNAAKDKQRRDARKAQWVDAQLIDVTMSNTVQSIAGAVVMMPLVAFVLYGLLSTPVVVMWVVCVIAVLLLRYGMLRTYRRRFATVLQGRSDFIHRYIWTWPLVSFSWALPAILCTAYPHSEALFVTVVVFVGIAVSGTTAFAAVPKASRYYVLGMVVPTSLVLLWRIWEAMPGQVPLIFLTGLPMLWALWWLMSMAGKRYYRAQFSSFALQFDNEELISSLTDQTRTALRAVAAKNRFLASAAHDLRQPVHALGLYAGWLQEDPEMSPELAPKILSATRAVNELFDSLFDLTRIDAGQYHLQVQRVSIKSLFEELVTQYAPSAKDKGLHLRVRYRDVYVQTDAVVLRRILGNYLSNAIKHTDGGGLLLAVRERVDSYVFEVWDTGHGIAPEHQEAVFQEFYRVARHAGSEDSLGLGLTIVSRLSGLLGYRPDLSSVRGKGSVFRLHVGIAPSMPTVKSP